MGLGKKISEQGISLVAWLGARAGATVAAATSRTWRQPAFTLGN
jgi:hypothetical protein